MIDQNFIINTDRLKKSSDQKQDLDFVADCDFLDLGESDIRFGEQLHVKGEAYLADQQLVLHIDLEVPVISSCIICNGDAQNMIKIHNFYHVVELHEIKSALFDIRPVIKDEVTLEIPRFSECNKGNCPDRELIKPYLAERK